MSETILTTMKIENLTWYAEEDYLKLKHKCAELELKLVEANERIECLEIHLKAEIDTGARYAEVIEQLQQDQLTKSTELQSSGKGENTNG